MRLRCPHNGCAIEVADDMVGARIRCPQCGELLFVDRQFELGGNETAVTAPAPAAPPAESEPADPLQAMYAGMPPLSVMLAIREGRGAAWQGASAIHANMTDEDWKALAAFEKVVLAAMSLQRWTWLAIPVSTFTLLLGLAAATDTAAPGSASPIRWIGLLTTLAMLTAGLIFMEVGRRRLLRLRIGVAVGLATWAAWTVASIFIANSVLALSFLFGNTFTSTPFGCVGLVAIPFYLMAAAGAGATGLRVQRSVNEVSPPPILNRLTEALSFLH